jgi:glycosyltransferase involved in cell wall biosynthesis
MRPYRILMVAPYAEGAWGYGGIPRVAGSLARGLARRGHRVAFVATDARDGRGRLARSAGAALPYELSLFRNLSNAAAFRLQLFLPLGMGRHLRRVVGSHDLVHVHARRNLPELLAVRAARRAGVPFVVMPNGTAARSERLLGAKRLWDLLAGGAPLREAARVLAVSAAEAEELRRLGVPAGRIARLPDPVDADDLRAPADPSGFRRRHGFGDAPLVLYLGRLAPRKQVETLVDAVSRLDDREVRLAIAGEDFGALGSIRARVERAALGGRVSWLGLLTGSERVAALAAADVVAYATAGEAFGLVPLEALLAGTPVVAASDSGSAEIVAASGGGRLVPAGDATALAAALAEILADRSGWRARARAAGAVVEREAGTDAVCARLESIYREVIDGGAGPDRPRR